MYEKKSEKISVEAKYAEMPIGRLKEKCTELQKELDIAKFYLKQKMKTSSSDSSN